MSLQVRKPEAVQDQQSKKTYHTPTLEDLGVVQELAQASPYSGSFAFDSGGTPPNYFVSA